MSLEDRIKQLESRVSRLTGDSKVGETRLGEFPVGESHAMFRHPGSAHFAGAGGFRPTFSTLVVTASRLYAVPIYFPVYPNNITTLLFEVTAALAGSAYMGVYANVSKNSLYPGTLLVSSSGVSTSATGIKNPPVDINCRAGLKWLAIQCQAAVTVRALSGTTPGVWAPIGAQTSTFTSYLGWSADLVFGTLPQSFPSGGAGRTTIPLLGAIFK